MTTIAIVDACSGNLRSVARAIARVGGTPVVTRDPEVVRTADKVIVPGQGSFDVFMRGLAERGLGDALREAIASGRPYLGICLGLQVLFDHGDEGDCAGLGFFAGRVTKLAPTDRRLKIPHMGWNQVRQRRAVPGISDGDYVYFVHSYRAVPIDRALVALEADHGEAFCAAIAKDNVLAVQFHPEKSQAVGLRLLESFVA